MTLLAKTITGTGVLLDHLNDGAGRLVGLRCLASGAAQLTVKNADGDVVVDVNSYTAPSVDSPTAIPASVSERIFGKRVLDPGQRNLVYNGDFAVNAGWTASAGGWAISGGAASCSGAQVTATDLYQDSAEFEQGKFYLLTYTMTRSAGTLTPKICQGAGTARSVGGTFTEIIKSSTTGNRLEFEADSSFVGSVDDVSIRLLSADDLLEVTSVTNDWQAVFETV